MRIDLSEFKLPGNPGVSGEVVYNAIAFDTNSGQDPVNEFTPAYYVVGHCVDDGSGVLIHGTRDDDQFDRHTWRIPRKISAPSQPDEGFTVTSTEFHNVESLPEPFIRLVGCVTTKEKGKVGFMYEGWLDGSGDWYPIEIPGAEETVVKGSQGGVLVCSAEDGSDSVHIYSLETHSWAELHTGYADDWTVDEIIPTESLYVLRLVHSDGRRSDIAYTPKK